MKKGGDNAAGGFTVNMRFYLLSNHVSESSGNINEQRCRQRKPLIWVGFLFQVFFNDRRGCYLSWQPGYKPHISTLGF